MFVERFKQVVYCIVLFDLFYLFILIHFTSSPLNCILDVSLIFMDYDSISVLVYV